MHAHTHAHTHTHTHKETNKHTYTHLERKGHLFAIPLQPLFIVFVKEMDLSPSSLYLSMQVEKVEKRPSASFPRPDNQTLWQLPLGVTVPEIYNSYASHTYSILNMSDL